MTVSTSESREMPVNEDDHESEVFNGTHILK